MSTILEQSEGPETKQMREMLELLKKESAEAHTAYENEVGALRKEFERRVGGK